MPERCSSTECAELLRLYKNVYTPADSSEIWFDKLTSFAVENGFAAKTKEYKENPNIYKGHIGDVSMIIRVAVTGKQASPDLYSVMRILGKETVFARIDRMTELLLK